MEKKELSWAAVSAGRSSAMKCPPRTARGSSAPGLATEAKSRHHLDLILGHGAFGVGPVILPAERFGAVAVAAQVGADDGEPFGQDGCDVVPGDMGLWVPVPLAGYGGEAWSSRRRRFSV